MINLPSQAKLLEIGKALGALRFDFGVIENREEQGGEDGNCGNGGEQLDERKAVLSSLPCPVHDNMPAQGSYGLTNSLFGRFNQASLCLQITSTVHYYHLRSRFGILRVVLIEPFCLNAPRMSRRRSTIRRKTKETQIQLQLNIDGQGHSKIKTGIPFFDHMLTLFAKHAVMDLKLRCDGDLEVDAHHTVEDCGIALGQAFLQALGDKKGIRRYGTGFIRRTRSPARPMCPWTNAWRDAWWILAAGPTWSGAG